MDIGRRKKREEKYTGPVAIGTLFGKYKTRLCPPQGIVIRAFCAVVSAELDVELAPAAVRYNPYSRTLYITASGPQKTEILLRKTRILAACRNTLGERGTPNEIV